ncbi:hybrid sensor histidine kinase/response regulator [Noviherbaspirillum galbum]|uniref:histidine kinase n=1 Tax=Noviherbaspirillum galbum TaxID=2709383 RepID=A0A6B3SSH3_9BURK|nr:hybrid sensor histidine kinase/response regulator [Noviherbaspirillum galbum]NEX63707.1 response regulator [Noviherbaspirillum galbum]
MTLSHSREVPGGPAPLARLTEGLSAGQMRTLRLLMTGVILTAVTVVLFLAYLAQSQYEQNWKEEIQAAERTAHVGSEHALKLFDTSHVLLDRLTDLVEDKSNADIAALEPQLHEKIKSMVTGLPQVQSIWLLDDAGHPVLSNRYLPAPRNLDLADRESFQAHLRGYRGLFITGALLGKKTREIFFDLTVRRETRDRKFAGTVQVSLYPEYLEQFYASMVPAGSQTAIALVRNDGTFIARWPKTAEIQARIPATSTVARAMAENTKSSVIDTVSSVDGILRKVAIRKVGDYPVYVAVGVTRDDVISGWRKEMAPLTVMALAAIAVILCLGFWLVRKTRQQFSLSNTLYAEVVQRQAAEKALLQSQKMEALGHLTSGVAHDFNNLLMTVDMSTHIIAEANPSLNGPERLTAIQRAVDTGAKLTRQLLSFSRRQPIAPAAVSLHELLPAIMDLCRPVLGSSVQGRLLVYPLTPAALLDRSEFELAILNLAINSRHAMPDGGIFEIMARPASGDAATAGQYVEILVSDTGSGMTQETLARVFEPFFTTRKNGQGTGLGLSQVKAMCEQVGGQVHLSSEPGHGTIVRLLLPAKDEVTQTPNTGPACTAVTPLRVLLVEDNIEIAEATKLALESLGCTVIHCGNAEEAVLLLKVDALELDLILSDVQMPGSMNGIDLAKQVRERYLSLPIVLMTGYAERLEDAQELGIRILAKPFGMPALRELLQSCATPPASVQPA